MRRLALAALLVVVALPLAGCGKEKKIDTPTLLSVLHRNGFRKLYVVYGLKVAAAQEKRIGQTFKAMDADAIYSSSYTRHNPLLMALVAAREPSAYEAKFRVSEDKPLFDGSLSPGVELPRGYRVRHLREIRVCNVVLDSYDTGRDPTLHARFDGVVKALQASC